MVYINQNIELGLVYTVLLKYRSITYDLFEAKAC